MVDPTFILRAPYCHVPQNPFRQSAALEAVSDGALAVRGEHIVGLGEYAELRRAHPEADVRDARGSLLLPGFVDTHVHYPQVHIIGAMGLRLLDWLKERTLPEEVRLADEGYARQVAKRFLASLVANGTTTAMVFGAHFARAQEVFFEEASTLGVRVTSGLVLSDRNLQPELESTPEACFEASQALIRTWHGRGRLRYAVTPRFSVSCSEAVLEMCQALLQQHPEVWFQTHINENLDEIAFVRELFPWAKDYLATYEHFGLVGERSVFAHNVHVSDDELTRLAKARAGVAHCPSSNMFIGSGLFAMQRHLRRGVRFALGSDVGGGTGFSLLKEGLMAYQGQMLLKGGVPIGPAHLLYLATRAGAELLGLADEVGDLTPGKSADLVLIRPPQGSTLEAVLAHSPSPEASLGVVFTLAREESVAEVYVAGERRFSRGSGAA